MNAAQQVIRSVNSIVARCEHFNPKFKIEGCNGISCSTIEFQSLDLPSLAVHTDAAMMPAPDTMG